MADEVFDGKVFVAQRESDGRFFTLVKFGDGTCLESDETYGTIEEARTAAQSDWSELRPHEETTVVLPKSLKGTSGVTVVLPRQYVM
jgi:hypothetical protein